MSDMIYCCVSATTEENSVRTVESAPSSRCNGTVCPVHGTKQTNNSYSKYLSIDQWMLDMYV